MAHRSIQERLPIGIGNAAWSIDVFDIGVGLKDAAGRLLDQGVFNLLSGLHKPLTILIFTHS